MPSLPLETLCANPRDKELATQRYGGSEYVIFKMVKRVHFVFKNKKKQKNCWISKGRKPQSSVFPIPRGEELLMQQCVCVAPFISWKRFHISVLIGYLIFSPCLGRLLPIIMYSLS
jgi:hypothetical protein